MQATADDSTPQCWPQRTTQNMDRETRLKIIAVLKAHPALWDKSSTEFVRFQRRMNSKTETWISVAKGLSDVGVKINMDRLRTDWTHLRLTFLKFANPEQRKKTKTDYELMLHEKLLALAPGLMDMSDSPSQSFTQPKVEVKATGMNSQQSESVICKLEETIPPQLGSITASAVEDTTTLIESTVPPTQPPIATIFTERTNVSVVSTPSCNSSVETIAQPSLKKDPPGVSSPPKPSHDSSNDCEHDPCKNNENLSSSIPARDQSRKRKAAESEPCIRKISKTQNSVASQTERVCSERHRLSLTDRQLRALHITIAPHGSGQWRRTTTVIRELRTFSQMIGQTVDNSAGTQYDKVAESVPQTLNRSVLNPAPSAVPRHQLQSSSFVPPFSYNPLMFEPSQFLASMQMMMGSLFGSANQGRLSQQAGTVYDTVATQRPPIPMHRNPSHSQN